MSKHMDASTITITSSIIEALGIGVFVRYLIKGLNAKVEALEETIEIQKGTINEIKKAGKTWEDLSKSLPKYFSDFDNVVSRSKERQIDHLECEIAL